MTSFLPLSPTDLQHLPSQTDCLSDVLRLVEPQPVAVLAGGGGVEGQLPGRKYFTTLRRGTGLYIPGQSDLAIALVQEDMRFVQEEGEDAGVKSVSDDHSGAAEHRYGPTEHSHVVKLSLLDNFMLKLRTRWILDSGV